MNEIVRAGAKVLLRPLAEADFTETICRLVPRSTGDAISRCPQYFARGRHRPLAARPSKANSLVHVCDLRGRGFPSYRQPQDRSDSPASHDFGHGDGDRRPQRLAAGAGARSDQARHRHRVQRAEYPQALGQHRFRQYRLDRRLYRRGFPYRDRAEGPVHGHDARSAAVVRQGLCRVFQPEIPVDIR